MAELQTTKRVRQPAAVLREEAGKQGAEFPNGDYVERMIADRVRLVAARLRVTARTALDSYVTEEEVRQWARAWPPSCGLFTCDQLDSTPK